MSLFEKHEMLRVNAAHEAMKRALYKFKPPLNTREALLALQGAVASVIVDGYAPAQRDEICQEHCKQVDSSVRKMTEANLGRTQ